MAKPQQTMDRKMRPEVNMQAPNTQVERAPSAEMESRKQKKHGMAKPLSDTKAMTDKEKKQEQLVVNTKNKTKPESRETVKVEKIFSIMFEYSAILKGIRVNNDVTHPKKKRRIETLGPRSLMATSHTRMATSNPTPTT